VSVDLFMFAGCKLRKQDDVPVGGQEFKRGKKFGNICRRKFPKDLSTNFQVSFRVKMVNDLINLI
jgi:hypothetical protein